MVKSIIMKPSFLLLAVSIFISCGSDRTKQATASLVSADQASTTIVCDRISDWERARTFTRKYMEAMPEEHYNFQPAPEILSFVDEFLHVACVNYRYAAMIAGSYDCSDYDDVYNNPDLESKEAAMAFVMDSYDAMIRRLQMEPDLNEPTHYYGWSCSKSCLAQKGFEHQSHHRGKAAVYLRLKGVTPPGHMLIAKWDMPKDISDEEWTATDDYKNYERLVDTP